MTGQLFIVPIMASLLLTGCISSDDFNFDEECIPGTVKGGGVEVVFDSAVLHDPARPRKFVVEIGGTRIESSVDEGIRAFGSLRIDMGHLFFDRMRTYGAPVEFVSDLESNRIVKDSSKRRGATGALSMGWVLSFVDVVLWMGMRSEDPAVRQEAVALFEHLCQREDAPFVADTGLRHFEGRVTLLPISRERLAPLAAEVGDLGEEYEVDCGRNGSAAECGEVSGVWDRQE